MFTRGASTQEYSRWSSYQPMIYAQSLPTVANISHQKLLLAPEQVSL